MSIILLPAHCDRAAAEALLPAMRAQATQGLLQIDASAVQQVGQAMLQLLLSARVSGKGAHITPSGSLIEAARLTGLENALFAPFPQTSSPQTKDPA